MCSDDLCFTSSKTVVTSTGPSLVSMVHTPSIAGFKPLRSIEGMGGIRCSGVPGGGGGGVPVPGASVRAFFSSSQI